MRAIIHPPDANNAVYGRTERLNANPPSSGLIAATQGLLSSPPKSPSLPPLFALDDGVEDVL